MAAGRASRRPACGRIQRQTSERLYLRASEGATIIGMRMRLRGREGRDKTQVCNLKRTLPEQCAHRLGPSRDERGNFGVGKSGESGAFSSRLRANSALPTGHAEMERPKVDKVERKQRDAQTDLEGRPREQMRGGDRRISLAFKLERRSIVIALALQTLLLASAQMNEATNGETRAPLSTGE